VQNESTGVVDPPIIATRLAEEMAVTSEVLAGVDSLPEVLRRLANRAREIAAAEYAAISTFDETGVLERFVFTGMSEADARRLGSPPRGRGLLGALARHDRPVRIDDLTTHPDFTGWPEGHPDMCAFLGVPIRATGQTIGSLYMTRTRGQPAFTATDEIAASMMALQAAISVSTAIVRERSGRLTLLEERARIAHDLHDGTIQALYAMGLEVDAMARDPNFPEPGRETLSQCIDRINALISDIRTYITMLEAETPSTSPELARDIAFILRQLVPAGVDTVTNISASALQDMSPRDTEDLLYIAREAISNAVRHGAPTKIAVDVRQSESETSLTVQDNGVGFDANQARQGLGSITMRTRAERLGANLTVLSIPGMGTTIRVQIPRAELDDDY